MVSANFWLVSVERLATIWSFEKSRIQMPTIVIFANHKMHPQKKWRKSDIFEA
ncbi:MAG: hypothetical protein RIS00_1184 [Pseudomonadota bacterium]